MKNGLTMVRKSGETGEMLPLLLRHEIQVLRRAKHSQPDVAARTGVSLATVRRVEREAVVVHVDDRGERKARQIGRPSKATPYAESVREWLAADPELPTQELLRRAQDAGYAGRKSAFYAVVAAIRPPPGPRQWFASEACPASSPSTTSGTST